MWTLQRFHQSISHAHVSGLFSLQLQCLLFVRVSLVKGNLCWKFTGKDWVETNGEGWRNFLREPKINFWTRFIGNSCRFTFGILFNWLRPAGIFEDILRAKSQCEMKKVIEIVANHVFGLFIPLTLSEKFNVKFLTPHTICQLFWFVAFMHVCVCVSELCEHFFLAINNWHGTLTSVFLRKPRGVRTRFPFKLKREWKYCLWVISSIANIFA